MWFATGSPAVPMGGFASSGGFSLMAVPCVSRGGADPLPTAATCFNLLRLPRYATRDRLERALLLAVRHGAVGFSML